MTLRQTFIVLLSAIVVSTATLFIRTDRQPFASGARDNDGTICTYERYGFPFKPITRVSVATPGEETCYYVAPAEPRSDTLPMPLLYLANVVSWTALFSVISRMARLGVKH